MEDLVEHRLGVLEHRQKEIKMKIMSLECGQKWHDQVVCKLEDRVEKVEKLSQTGVVETCSQEISGQQTFLDPTQGLNEELEHARQIREVAYSSKEVERLDDIIGNMGEVKERLIELQSRISRIRSIEIEQSEEDGLQNPYSTYLSSSQQLQGNVLSASMPHPDLYQVPNQPSLSKSDSFYPPTIIS